jgi:WD40 repeat protein
MDERGLIAGGLDGSLRVWSVEGERVELSMEGKGHEASVDAIDLRDGKILSASADGSLKLWSSDPEEGETNEESTSLKRKKRRTQKTHPTKVLSQSLPCLK